MSVDRFPIRQYLLQLQETLCKQLVHFESNKQFQSDEWQRSQGGGGISRVLQHGYVFDSAGVNFSHIKGHALPQSATRARPELAGKPFEAMGVSCVIHPKNPFVPTSHMNVRFFTTTAEGETPIWWFGGGFDLTPYYPFEEDVIHWHKTALQACQPFGDTIYPYYKAWADEYYYLPHRKEARGVGGLFFDDLNTGIWGWDLETCFAFMQSVGDHFSKAYMPMVEKRLHHPFEASHQAFQHYRRGRYVEFNLIYDRGTLFGLQSGGRTESILMSLPPKVAWEYQKVIAPDSKEARLTRDFLQPKDWIDVPQTC